ncbi:MAG: hypothetical protein LH609_13190 [Rudanella sp.]|nr:hypothetical protein [Rudanella sp.]
MRELFGKLDATQTRNNFVKGVEYLRNRPDSTGKVDCVGFAGVAQWPTNWL